MISLVGLPGCGKSTVGRQLSRRLALPFVDSDHIIESRLGCSIREYFEREGEDCFRDWESLVLEEITQGSSAVISTGGGAVLRERNRRLLREKSRVIYLRSTPEEVFRRIKYDRTRPLLQVANPMQKLKDLYRIRDPLYRQAAHFIIDTGRPTVASLVNMIQMQLELASEA